MKNINVLYVSHFNHMKMGGQRSMTFLIENLDRNRFTPFALVPSAGELSERLESSGCKTFFAPLVSLKPKNISKAFGLPEHIRNILIDNDIKIIHPDYPSDTFMCWMAKRKLDIKLIWHVRWTEKFFKDRLFERIVDGMIGVSDAAGRRFSESAKIRAKYRTIYNGVDCQLFKPVEDRNSIRRVLDMPENRFILIFVGILKDGKGVYDLANAMGILRKKYSDELMPYLYYVGTAPNQEKLEQLNNLIKENNCSEFVRIIPQQKNIHEWMQAADALAIPSHEGNEGMPRVMYEALACGTAGIGTDISGVNEAITPSTGILVDEKNPDSLALGIAKLVDDPLLLKELQQKGRQRALDFFDIRNHARDVMNFYDEILSR